MSGPGHDPVKPFVVTTILARQTNDPAATTSISASSRRLRKRSRTEGSVQCEFNKNGSAHACPFLTRIGAFQLRHRKTWHPPPSLLSRGEFPRQSLHDAIVIDNPQSMPAHGAFGIVAHRLGRYRTSKNTLVVRRHFDSRPVFSQHNVTAARDRGGSTVMVKPLHSLPPIASTALVIEVHKPRRAPKPAASRHQPKRRIGVGPFHDSDPARIAVHRLGQLECAWPHAVTSTTGLRHSSLAVKGPQVPE